MIFMDAYEFKPKVIVIIKIWFHKIVIKHLMWSRA